VDYDRNGKEIMNMLIKDNRKVLANFMKAPNRHRHQAMLAILQNMFVCFFTSHVLTIIVILVVINYTAM
jgi:hypothetical protein